MFLEKKCTKIKSYVLKKVVSVYFYGHGMYIGIQYRILSVALSICLHHDSFLLRLISQPDLLLLKY